MRSRVLLVCVVGCACTFDASGTGMTTGEASSTGSVPAGATTSASASTTDETTTSGGMTDSEDAADTGDTTGSNGAVPAPLRDCAAILAAESGALDGVYIIDLDGEDPLEPFEVYCDMRTDGGGWTLVYSYGFTTYDTFTNGNNAVSVRPDWGISIANPTPISSTIPLQPGNPGAMAFETWREFGTSFLVRSNINNAIVCDEVTGSLVTGTPGEIDCRIVLDVTGTCTDVVPTSIRTRPYGPALAASNVYYYWDGSLDSHWPTHDPCGQDQPNHLTGVDLPFGAVFIRP